MLGALSAQPLLFPRSTEAAWHSGLRGEEAAEIAAWEAVIEAQVGRGSWCLRLQRRVVFAERAFVFGGRVRSEPCLRALCVFYIGHRLPGLAAERML